MMATKTFTCGWDYNLPRQSVEGSVLSFREFLAVSSNGVVLDPDVVKKNEII